MRQSIRSFDLRLSKVAFGNHETVILEHMNPSMCNFKQNPPSVFLIERMDLCTRTERVSNPNLLLCWGMLQALILQRRTSLILKSRLVMQNGKREHYRP